MGGQPGSDRRGGAYDDGLIAFDTHAFRSDPPLRN
jgi:hypothetical protein